MRHYPDKPASPQAVTAAIVFTAIMVAMAGSTRATVAVTPGQGCAMLSSMERTRLIAAAVAATRDLFGVDRSIVAASTGREPIVAEVVNDGIGLREQTAPGLPARRLAPRLTNLPPPIC